MAKVIRMQAFHDAELRSFCRRVLHGHSKKGKKGYILCVLPDRVVGEKWMKNVIAHFAAKRQREIEAGRRQVEKEEAQRIGRESIPPGRVLMPRRYA